MTILNKLLKGESFLEITRNNSDFLAPEKLENEKYLILLHNTGFLEIVPKKSADTAIIISTAIHGNETAPIEICDEVISEVLTQKLELKYPTLFILGNPRAMNIAKRFVDYNLNRLFVGTHKRIEPCYETKRASEIESVVEDFYQRHDLSKKWHYDLHTAIKPSQIEKFAISPYSPTNIESNEQLNMMEALGAEAILFSKSESTTFSYHTKSLYGAHSFTVELGKVHPFGENPSESFTKTRMNLRKILSKEITVSSELNKDLKLFNVHHSAIKKSDDFDFYFPDDTKNFTLFKKGEKIYHDLGKDYIADKDMRVIFPNKDVIIGQRAALLIIES